MTRPFTFLLFAALACGQAPPAFEVASVRPAPQPPPGTPNPPVSLIDNAHVKLHLPLQGIVCAAYGVRADQVAGPAWIVNTRFDIEAKLPDGATAEQVPAMLQALLADRFKMTMHHESRDQTVSALVVSKDGFKLQPKPAAAAGAEPAPRGKRDGCYPHADTSITQTAAAFNMAVVNGDTKITSGPKGQRIEVSSIPSLVNFLGSMLMVLGPLSGNPSTVIDKTGLAGDYDIVLEQKAPPAGITAEEALDQLHNPWFLKALDTLGLKLEKQKVPVDTIVIDSIEKTPTAN